MDDSEVLKQIQSLVDEENDLRAKAATGGAGAHVHERLQSLEVSLDQCWDLLRQRRGLRHAGADPDGAHVRDESTVERFQQ